MTLRRRLPKESPAASAGLGWESPTRQVDQIRAAIFGASLRLPPVEPRHPFYAVTLALKKKPRGEAGLSRTKCVCALS
jgi:hypothetical protein